MVCFYKKGEERGQKNILDSNINQLFIHSPPQWCTSNNVRLFYACF